MVAGRLARARAAAASVCDPEIPVLSIDDLGVLRDVGLDGEAVTVTITPTYTGCPAMDLIAAEIETAVRAAGFPDVAVRTVLSPAWTTDWISAEGRRKLAEFGIAPPPPACDRLALFGADDPACPRCGSVDTERISAFGSTACKSLHRCRTCREPFDAFKCH